MEQRLNNGFNAAGALGALFAVLWAGMIVGVSFIATPAKFLAPSLGDRTAFDVGRATFELFCSIEVGLALVLLGLVLYAWRRLTLIGLAVSVLAITFMQAFVVLPVLSDRVAAIVAGYGVPPSHVHLLYVSMEIAKTGLLVALASCCVLLGTRRESRGSAERSYRWATS